MKKILILAVTATALAATPSFAKGGNIGIGAKVLTGKSGVLGLLNGRSTLVVNTAVPPARVACSAPCLVAAASSAAAMAAVAAAVTERSLR